MRWILSGLLGVLIVLVSFGVAAQESLCGDREYFLKQLEEKFSEVVEHVAITERGAFVEWTVAPSGSWSMLVTIGDGPTCIIAGGDDWQDKMENEVELEGTKA